MLIYFLQKSKIISNTNIGLNLTIFELGSNSNDLFSRQINIFFLLFWFFLLFLFSFITFLHFYFVLSFNLSSSSSYTINDVVLSIFVIVFLLFPPITISLLFIIYIIYFLSLSLFCSFLFLII